MSTETDKAAQARNLSREIDRRRTFAIISHPDAGKTTFTEKLLLYGGAIHLAGAVKAKKNQKFTTSDWMEIEKQRGISISTTVLQFDYEDARINLLDTPGHKDFSEDTYRTLMAVDAAVMLIDAAKGVEPQTRKLFEVCRMRGIPIFTFVNKLDRPSQEPLELMDELEKVLGIRTCPITWPIGSGDRFRGVYDRESSQVMVFQTDGEANVKERLSATTVSGLDDPYVKKVIGGPRGNEHEAQEILETLKSELELVDAAGERYDRELVLAGELTPVFFGSALNNFGVESFLKKFIDMAPPPQGRGDLAPNDPKFSGFIFKILANMDPKHRDRVAFMRICSGVMRRNELVYHKRLEEEIKLSMPLQFLGQERVIVPEAFPGDIVGLLDTSGNLRIGDTLSDDKKVKFPELPTFSPENFASIQILDPMKRKQLKKGVDQLSEEGVVQVYAQRGLGDKDPIIGAVGNLQFEVFQFRVKAEYGVDIKMIPLPFTRARWVRGPKEKLDDFFAQFEMRSDTRCLLDRDQNPVVLFTTEWAERWAKDHFKDLHFDPTSH